MSPSSNNTTTSKNEKPFTPPARYVSLPAEIYALRDRFPAAADYVMLECKRCFQWVPVEVTQKIPDENPDNGFRMPSGSSSTNAKQKEARDGDEPWHSLRLRARQAQSWSSSLGIPAKEGSERLSSSPAWNTSLFIPNPASFVCSGILCAKGDQLREKRLEWLNTLYSICKKGEKTDGKRQSSRQKIGETDLNDSLVREMQELINEKLSSELDIRRSKRVAASNEHNDLRLEETCISSEEMGKWLSTKGSISKESLESIVTLISAKDAVLSSCFCWVVCDCCGKIRRTAQPFPGGSPFVCALSSVGSCAISEMKGIEMYNRMYTTQTLNQIELASSTLPHFVDVNSNSGHRDSKSQLNAYQTDPVMKLLLSHPHFKSSYVEGVVQENSVSGRGALSSQKLFPLLKDLTHAVRKKSASSFLKSVILNPKEIRKKREAVLAAMFQQDDSEKSNAAPELPVESKRQAPPPPPSSPDANCAATIARCVKKEENESMESEVLKSTRHSLKEVQASENEHLKEEAEPIDEVQSKEEKEKSDKEHINRTSSTLEVPIEDASPTVSKDGKNGGTRKRGRKPKERVIYWIQCDRCDKWRIVPRPIQPETWECTMRRGTTCADPEDTQDD